MTLTEQLAQAKVGQKLQRKDGKIVTLSTIDPGAIFPYAYIYQNNIGEHWLLPDGSSCCEDLCPVASIISLIP